MDKQIANWIESNLDFIKKYQKPLIEIQKNDDTILLGDSKVGGMPDLPFDFDWPEYDGKPMTFFAQINLKDIAHLNDTLPNKGWLFFFIYFDEPLKFGCHCDFIPKREQYAVLYFNGDKNELEEYYYPSQLPESLRFGATKIQFEKKFMLPYSREYIALKYSKQTDKFFQTLLDLCNFKRSSNSKILGYPQLRQYDVIYDWSRQYHNDYNYTKTKTVNQFAEKQNQNFVTLLEFDCSEGLHAWSGDGIYLDGIFSNFKKIGSQQFYFGILKDDLLKLNFNNSLLVMQDT